MSATTLSAPTTLPMSHDRIQQECFKWLWNQYPNIRRTFFHCPNEYAPGGEYMEREIRGYLKRVQKLVPGWLQTIFSSAKKDHIIKLSQRKAIGLLPGVTDLVFYYQGVLYMFDIKIGKDSLSDAQLDFIAAMEDQGGKFYEIESLIQFQSIIQEIIPEIL
ncbi:MAG: hypothetical protein Q8R83_06010 [Legionellaceae bacterium]|nr:hypothetical protein [Legionellaceae bacterium]